MLRIGYLFERFPSFGQTFCYREVAELERQGVEAAVFSIRRPSGEPPQDWDENIVRRVTYLPDEAELVKEIDRAARKGDLPPAAVEALKEWERQPDFLRLYQGAYIGLRLRRAGITHVHAHFAGMAARTAYWVKRFFGIDFSLTAHANDIFAPRNFTIGLGKLFAEAAAIVTVSDFAVEHLRTQFPEHAGKFRRVYNGIEVERFVPATLGAEIPSIISIGRLIEKKGFADLISACGQLKSAGVKFRCEIIGEGPLAAALAAQIDEAQLGAFVRLAGARSQAEIARPLAAASLFVLPCTTEADGGMDNLPTVIMEAMASGLPVISTPIAGVPEMVQPGVTGLLAPERNPAALADEISVLIADPAKSRAMGEAGRQVATDKFSIEGNVRALIEVFGQTQ